MVWLVNYVAMLLVVCQLSRDVIGCYYLQQHPWSPALKQGHFTVIDEKEAGVDHVLYNPYCFLMQIMLSLG